MDAEGHHGQPRRPGRALRHRQRRDRDQAAPQLRGLRTAVPHGPGTFAPPRAGGLQVFLQRRLDTDALPAFHVGNDARFGGAIHRPGAACGAGPLATAGTAADIYGAMVCDTIGGVGQWHFHYDESLEFIGNTDFGTQRWDER